MNIRFWLFTSMATLLVAQINSQPAVCPPDEMTIMTPFCEDACIICDIDGFSGRNGRDENYFLPADFCTLTQHNGKWIGFIAGSENLEVSLAVSNCEQGIGLEIAIYEAINCDNYTLVSNCFGGFNSIPAGSFGVFSNTVPLTIGQYYYLVMDGGLDDVCDWEFTVLSGTTAVQPLTGSGPFSGPLNICPGVTANYLTEIETGATEFTWTVDGMMAADGPLATISFDENGTYELCVTAANACDEASPFCRNIIVSELPTTIIDTTFCTGETFIFAGSTITESGQYNFDFTTAAGCDSNFVLNVTEITADDILLDLVICNDDVITINGQNYNSSGTYTQALTNQFGCDSTITIELETLDCTADATFTVSGISCPGESDGAIDFIVSSGELPFVYQLQLLSGELVFSGTGSALNETININGLPEAQYQLVILDPFGAIANVLNVHIVAPPALDVDDNISSFAGFNTSCFGSSDGQITLTPNGGNPPYSLIWQDGNTSFSRSSLNAGSYAFTLTDQNGCSLQDELLLSQPTAITASIDSINPGCAGPNSGSIMATAVAGGAGGYLFRLNDGRVVTDSAFSGLSADTYTLEIIDVNGCISSFQTNLRSAVIPVVDISDDAVIIGLGESARISFNSFNTDTIFFSSDVNLNIIDSGQQFISLMPLMGGQLMVTGISVDGCVVSDSIRIVIDGQRNVYAPNAFSPNADGVNDDFRLFYGPSVMAVEDLKIFDRWGSLQFEQSASNQAVWTGLDASPGIYVWTANIIYQDGFVEERSGSVVLLK